MKKRENKSFEKAWKVALSGILCALCFVIMYVGSLSGITDLLAVVVTAMIVVIAVIEIGGIYPWLIWTVTGVLCLILVPDKYVALEFILFGGIYPMVKSYLERFPTFISFAMKILYFNVAFAGSYAVAKYIFAVNDVGFDLAIVSFILANLFFILSDVYLSLMISAYMVKLRPRLRRQKKD